MSTPTQTESSSQPTSSAAELPGGVDWPELNAAQRTAVAASLDPQLVVAGPGTGKTRVLVCRAAYLLERYAEALRPSQVAVITFTRKAARQLTARLSELVGPRAQHVQAGTIHRFCSRILDAHAERLDDVPPDFVVASDAVTDAFWQRWFEDHERACKQQDLHSFRQVKTRVSRAKMGIESLPGLLQEPLRTYEELLRSRGALDFDDLLVKARDLVEHHPAVRRAVRKETRVLLVDEFQDTDPVQYRVLWRIGNEGRPDGGRGAHLFCVADDDQSIYRFRGAEPKNLQRYIDRYGCARDAGTFHVLQKNYRSNRAIYTVAETVLAGRERLKQRGEIETVNPARDPVEIVSCDDEAAEMAHVFATVQRWIEAGTPRREIGVLAPWNATVQALEQRFLRAGIACEASSTDPILQEPAVRTLVAALHMVRRVLQQQDFDGPLDDLLQTVLPEDVYSQVRAFWEQQSDVQQASLWGTFQRLARDGASAGRAGLGAYGQHLGRLYAAIGNVLQHARTSDATVGSVAEEILRQLGGATQLLHDADVADPRDGHGMAEASARLRRWREAHSSRNARLLLHDRRGRRLQIWRQLLLRGLDLADGTPDLSSYDAPALFLAAEQESPAPLAADDLVVTADLEGFARWANRYGALDGEQPPHVLHLTPEDIPEETLRLAGMDPERIHPVAPEGSRRPTVRLFKLLQATVAPATSEPLFDEYVMVDLETTSADPDRCRVAEIGAVHVREGEEVDAFRTLVALPEDITADEIRTLRDVCDLDPDTDFDEAVPLREAWAQLCDFAGARPLVAHNGRQFDFRILQRLRARFADAVTPQWTTTYDTLPTAIELCPELKRHTAEHLRTHLLGEDEDTAHRALADCRDQVRLFEALQSRRAVRRRAGALEPLLPLVVAGLYDEAYATPDEAAFPLADDDRALLDVGYRWALRDASSVRGVLRRVLPRALPELVRATPALYDAIDEAQLLEDGARPGLSGRIDALFAPYRNAPIREGLAETLRHLALWRTDDPEQGNDVVTLSTYHSAKGLEFERVICTGVHDDAFPPFHAETADARRESRRLLYVGMTRAEQHLMLTYPNEAQQGWTRKRSRFLQNVPEDLVEARPPQR